MIALGSATPALIKRLGIFRINLFAISLTALGFACFSLFDDIALYVFGSISIGAALTVRWISCDTLVIQQSADAHVGRNVGIHETLMGGGLAVGPLMLWLSDYGYGLVLLSVLVMSGVATLLLYFDSLHFETSASVGHAEERLTLDRHTKKEASGELGQALMSAFFGGFIEASFVAFLPAFVISQGYSVAAGGLVGFAFGLGGTLLQPLMGVATSRARVAFVQLSCVVLIVICLIGAIAVMNTGYSLTSPAFLSLIFFAGGWIGGANTLAVIDCGTRLESHLIEFGVARIATFYTVGAVAGPLIVGAIAWKAGDVALIYTCTAFALLLLLISGNFAKVKGRPI
ncbi:MFS transporter [Salinisphaera hydrothermalis]|uniref:MFS transporter n=1 Tax=Salinisphaera hydrothermalis TaxID=563188 RepID=UPI00333EA145